MLEFAAQLDHFGGIRRLGERLLEERGLAKRHGIDPESADAGPQVREREEPNSCSKWRSIVPPSKCAHPE